MAAGDTTAVVLSGGVAYAAYEVGVMKALFRGQSPATDYQPLQAHVFKGTSAGAFNAAMMASQPGTDSATTIAYLERTWISELAYDSRRCGNGAVRFRANLRGFLDPVCLANHPLQPLGELAGDLLFFARGGLQRAVQFATTRASLARRSLELLDPGALVSADPALRSMQRRLSLEGIRRSEKILLVSATDWRTGEERVFSNKDMTDDLGHDVILAAMAFPGLPPVAIGGSLYMDAALVMDWPLKSAIQAGADTIHSVYMDPDPKNIPVRRLYNVVDVLDKTYALLMASIFARDFDRAAAINAGLEIVEGLTGEGRLSQQEADRIVQLIGRVRLRSAQESHYRKLTLHRYNPDVDLGGVLGALNFDRDHLAGLIEQGFRDAVNHDCKARGCILPAGNDRSAPGAPADLEVPRR